MGITPADAGKTAPARAQTCLKWDHPRGCGENNIRLSDSADAVGSPPRMRGKHDLIESGFANNGITPADAGKTGYEMAQEFTKGDHPRGCGENNTAVLK